MGALQYLPSRASGAAGDKYKQMNQINKPSLFLNS